jgi:hypothetical protein
MRTQIIDDRTYVVGDMTIQVDDTLELVDSEKESLAKIQELNRERMKLQQDLINQCLQTDRNYVPAMTDASVRIADVTLEMSYSMNVLLNDIYKRMGGMLPLLFEEDYTSLKVRPKQPDEELNYTTKYVKNQVGFDRFEDVIAVMRDLTEAPEEIGFDIDLNTKHKIQPLILSRLITTSDLPAIADSVKKIVEKKSDVKGMVILINCKKSIVEGDEREGSTIFFMEERPTPQRIDRMKGIAKITEPSGVVVVRMGQQQNPMERTFNVWYYGKDGGKEVKQCHPINLVVQPRSLEVGEVAVGKFDPGAMYEEFIN